MSIQLKTVGIAEMQPRPAKLAILLMDRIKSGSPQAKDVKSRPCRNVPLLSFTVPVCTEALPFIIFAEFNLQEGLGHGGCWVSS